MTKVSGGGGFHRLSYYPANITGVSYLVVQFEPVDSGKGIPE